MKISRNGALATMSLATVALVATGCSEGGDSAQAVNGEGSTAQQKAMQHFSDVLTENSDIILDYTGSGSGDGIKKFIGGDVDFAGSDSPLSDEEAIEAKARCNDNDAWHIPLVAGPVAIAYNLDGVDGLVLSPAVIADIFQGKIKTWNDPAIAALNAGVSLPAEEIVPVYRSDSSGTTDNFQRFLSDAAPQAWTLGHGKEFKPEGVGSGAAKSTGVGDTVSKTAGSVTYVEWGFATENDLGVAKIDFGSGPVELNTESAGKALDQVTFAEPGSKNLIVDTDALFASKEAGAYPLLLTPYSIVCSTGYAEESTSTTLKDAFTQILDNGQEGLAEIGYVPLPEGYATTLRGTIDALAGGN